MRSDLLAIPVADLVLAHVQGSLEAVQLDVQSARVADRRALLVPPPERGRASVTVRAGRVFAQASATVL